jgi:hypothetical protein
MNIDEILQTETICFQENRPQGRKRVGNIQNPGPFVSVAVQGQEQKGFIGRTFRRLGRGLALPAQTFSVEKIQGCLTLPPSNVSAGKLVHRQKGTSAVQWTTAAGISVT